MKRKKKNIFERKKILYSVIFIFILGIISATYILFFNKEKEIDDSAAYIKEIEAKETSIHVESDYNPTDGEIGEGEASVVLACEEGSSGNFCREHLSSLGNEEGMAFDLNVGVNGDPIQRINVRQNNNIVSETDGSMSCGFFQIVVEDDGDWDWTGAGGDTPPFSSNCTNEEPQPAIEYEDLHGEGQGGWYVHYTWLTGVKPLVVSYARGCFGKVESNGNITPEYSKIERIEATSSGLSCKPLDDDESFSIYKPGQEYICDLSPNADEYVTLNYKTSELNGFIEGTTKYTNGAYAAKSTTDLSPHSNPPYPLVRKNFKIDSQEGTFTFHNLCKEQKNPDVTLIKKVNKTEVSPGEEIIYTIIIKNDGTATAKDVQVTDDIYQNFELLDISSDPIIEPEENGLNGTKYTWNLGNIAPGGEETITMKFKVKEDALGGEIIKNKACVAGGNFTGVPCKEQKVTIKIVAPKNPDLDIDKRADKTNVYPGDEVTYTITVTNKDTATAEAKNVIVSDIFNDDYLILPPLRVDNNPTVNNNEYEWKFDTLGIDESKEINITFKVKDDITEESVIPNVACVKSDLITNEICDNYNLPINISQGYCGDGNLDTGEDFDDGTSNGRLKFDLVNTCGTREGTVIITGDNFEETYDFNGNESLSNLLDCETEGGICISADEDCGAGYDPVGASAGYQCSEQGQICCLPNETPQTECSGEGEPGPNASLGPNDTNLECCEGLTALDAGYPVATDCDNHLDGAGTVCGVCGDGNCASSYENPCNCPEDCDFEDQQEHEEPQVQILNKIKDLFNPRKANAQTTSNYISLPAGTYNYEIIPKEGCGGPVSGSIQITECHYSTLTYSNNELPSIVKEVNNGVSANLKAGDSGYYTITYSNTTSQILTNVKITDPFDNQNQNYLSFISQSSNPSVPFDNNTNLWTIGSLAPNQSGTITINFKVLENAPGNITINNDATMTWDKGILSDNAVVTPNIPIYIGRIIIAPQTGIGLLAIVSSLLLGGGVALIYILSKKGLIKFIR